MSKAMGVPWHRERAILVKKLVEEHLPRAGTELASIQ